MLNNSGLLLAVSFVAAIASAVAAPVAQNTAYPGSTFFPDSLSTTPHATGLQYQAGAYFYGSDCGGNSAMMAATAPRHIAVPGGVILAGAAGRLIALDLNCDDRRHALTSYRDAFEGRIGQRYDWRNENGGGAGSITPVRQYSSGGVACRGFRAETAIISQQPTSREGTACRQRDGNWHTQ